MNNRHFLIFEKAFVILGVLFFSSSIPKIFAPPVILSLIRYTLWFGSTFLLCLRWQTTWFVARRGLLVWIITGLSVISIMWSHNPAYTKVVVREVLQMTTFGLYVASRFKLREQLSLIACSLGIIALASTLLALGMPSIGIDQTKFGGAWTGVFSHKNGLGKFMSLSVAVFSLIAADSQFYQRTINRLLGLAGLFLSLTLVFLSTSGTGLAIAIISIFLIYIYRFYQNQGNKRSLYFESITLLTIILVSVLANSWENILTSMGKDITLTGRTEIWGAALFLLFKENLLLGFGRGAFWAPGSQFAQIAGAAAGNKYIAPHSHNGYIDLALEIGCLGLLLFLISFIISYRNAITRSFISRTAKDLWPMVSLSWLFFYNFTESSLMNQANIFWPLYIAAALCAKPSGRIINLRTPKKAYLSIPS